MITEIDVAVPVRTAYDQWTQFEDFPLFMDHVTEVRQTDDVHLHWTASIAGVTREWDAEITEQSPDQRVAWTSTNGTDHSGVVTFHALDDDTTRVVLQFEMHPDGLIEHIADKGGFVKDRAETDLSAFKDFIEARGRATGEWRESVDRDPNRSATSEHERLESMTRDELYELAQERDVEHRSTMSKDELVDALAPEPAR
jgi:uncharacterized membrane protein